MSIDPATFHRDYHDPKLHTEEVARRYGLEVGVLARFARSLGIPSRTEAGIRVGWKPKEPRRYGQHGCNATCPGWEACNRMTSREPLPCEIYAYLDEDPELIDSGPDYHHPAIPIELTVRLEDLWR